MNKIIKREDLKNKNILLIKYLLIGKNGS